MRHSSINLTTSNEETPTLNYRNDHFKTTLLYWHTRVRPNENPNRHNHTAIAPKRQCCCGGFAVSFRHKKNAERKYSYANNKVRKIQNWQHLGVSQSEKWVKWWLNEPSLTIFFSFPKLLSFQSFETLYVTAKAEKQR